MTDPELCLSRLRSLGIRRFVVPDVACSLTEWDFSAPGVYRCFGCHPGYAASFRRCPVRSDTLAVGECGLEPSESDEERLQEEVFASQVKTAREHGLPLVIHSIRRDDAILHLLKDLQFSGGGVIHGFGGSWQMARRWLDAGFYLGIGTLLLNPAAARLRQAVVYAGAGRILLETDAPCFRNVRAEALIDVAAACSQLLGVDMADLSRATENSAGKLFGFDPLDRDQTF